MRNHQKQKTVTFICASSHADRFKQVCNFHPPGLTDGARPEVSELNDNFGRPAALSRVPDETRNRTGVSGSNTWQHRRRTVEVFYWGRIVRTVGYS